MGRKAILVDQGTIIRALAAVKKAGIEIRTVRIEPNGAVVINGEGSATEGRELAPEKKSGGAE
jgi:hypothetical protein